MKNMNRFINSFKTIAKDKGVNLEVIDYGNIKGDVNASKRVKARWKESMKKVNN
jgi:hypothetical protein